MFAAVEAIGTNMAFMHPPGDLTTIREIPEMEVIMHLCKGWQYCDPPSAVAPKPTPLRPPLVEPAKAMAVGAALPVPRAGRKRSA
jgi:hypothetical protein